METHLREAVGQATEVATGKYRVKLISADKWGSTAYYSSEVLQRDGKRVFHKGLHMYQDHLSEAEQWDRPEGSIMNLVGTLDSDAEYDADGPEGPGLYADAQFYPSYVTRIAEIKKDVGLSVDAQGLTESGERDGRVGPVLVALLTAKSVDVVTKPGAGGKVLHMIESDRGLAGRPIEKENQSMTDVTKEDFEALVAKFDSLPGLFAAALKDAGLVPASAKANETVVENGTDNSTAEAVTNTADATNTSTESVTEIDFGHVVEALRSQNLPGVVATPVIAAIKQGKTLDDAIAEQVALREAFVETSAEKGSVHIQESDKAPRGLARAVTVLK